MKPLLGYQLLPASSEVIARNILAPGPDCLGVVQFHYSAKCVKTTAIKHANPIGYAASSEVANVLVCRFSPQRACLCLLFCPGHCAEIAKNSAELKANIVFFFRELPY